MADDFMLGVNYPWRHYGQDFGSSRWGYRGLAGAAAEFRHDLATIGETLGRESRKLLRIFIFADGRCSPKFGPAGEVEGYDDSFFKDFDCLVETASAFDFALIPVLLDFRWCHAAAQCNGVQVGGHSQIITDNRLRDSFLDRALSPLLRRYRNCPLIFAWDLFNEPEWVLARHRWRRHPSISLDEARDFIFKCVERVHADATQSVTLGSARPAWLKLWTGLGLDIYQCHWYGLPWRLRLGLKSAAGQRLDGPCIIGETQTAGLRVPPAKIISLVRRKGYAGLLFWSYRAEDRASDFSRLGSSDSRDCPT